MLINGKPVQGNITGLIKKLGELPSSFPEYIIVILLQNH